MAGDINATLADLEENHRAYGIVHAWEREGGKIPDIIYEVVG